MENQEAKGDEKGCCSKSKSCGGKAVAALALVLVGGLGGYLMGRHCGKSCEIPAAHTQAK